MNISTPLLYLVMGFFLCGCSRTDYVGKIYQTKQEAGFGNISTNWVPDTEDLDLGCKYDARYSSLDAEVKNFYEFMRSKDWKPTYELRWKRFKDTVSEQSYLNDVEHELPEWELLNYDVLSVNTYDSDDAVLICRFVEMPGPTVTFSVVDWRKEKDGIWRCDTAGPQKIQLFRYLEYNKKPDEN